MAATMTVSIVSILGSIVCFRIYGIDSVRKPPKLLMVLSRNFCKSLCHTANEHKEMSGEINDLNRNNHAPLSERPLITTCQPAQEVCNDWHYLANFFNWVIMIVIGGLMILFAGIFMVPMFTVK